MRILYLIRSTDPAGGGPVESIQQFGRALTELGASVEVASLDCSGAEYIGKNEFKVHALGPGLLKYGYAPAFKRWLAEHAAQYDLFIVNGIWQYNALAAWRVLRSTRKPYFVFLHGMLDPWFNRQYPLKYLKKAVYWLLVDHRVLRDAAAVLFTSAEERIAARGSFSPYRCKEVLLGYGTGGKPTDTARREGSLYQRFPELAGGGDLYLYLGRLHEKKGIDLLIRAFANLQVSGFEAKLVIAGPDKDGYIGKLRALAKRFALDRKLFFLGPLYGDIKWAAYEAADVFVLPSHQENFAITVAEALSCGTPVIISNKVNIWREIVAEGAGIVCNDTIESVREALEQWSAASTSAKTRMRAAARACYENHYDIKIISKRLYALAKEAVDATY